MFVQKENCVTNFDFAKPATSRAIGAALLAAAMTLCGNAAAAENVSLDDMRAAVEKYKDVNAALADGYIQDPSGHCVHAAAEGMPMEWGAMGIHYLRPDLLKLSPPGGRVNGMGTHTDFMQPAILLYEPRDDGSLELVGAENLVFKEAWHAAGHDGPPMLNGRAWDHMADDPATEGDEAHGFMPHYDQHVWLFRENPSGDLMPFNPNVTCEHHAGMGH
ncbi:hypothetical protein PGB28_05065 [Primorskyibacter aestuariivivens]|uniref:hypothetical protein n=1 Tax=Primorskyibacter aestuariivivens TaxID=1888912 RepID=UPI002301EF37|nr:hypothetical protein [Primorskyibacter aestuariivivens]MDA7427821.1 hypothetical protein [Primorskyibacter aestuariivivens]